MKYFSLFFTLLYFSLLNGQIVDSTFGEPYSFVASGHVPGLTAADFSEREDRAYSMLFLEDDKIIMAGHTAGENDTDFAFTRLLPNGQYDQTAGQDGKVQLDLGFQHDSCLVAIRYGTDQMLMGGSVEGPEEAEFSAFLIRTDFDGNLDASFGEQGKLRIELPGQREMITKLETLPNGNIIIAGNIYYGDSYRQPDSTAIFVGRLFEDGSIDTSFGNNGFIYKKRINCASALLGDLQVYPDGSFIITGGIYDPYPGDVFGGGELCERPIYVSRYLANGAIDLDFAEGGTVDIPFTIGWGNALYLYEDGRIIVTGLTSDGLIDPIYTLVTRLLPNGQPDSSFAENGSFREYIPVFEPDPLDPVDVVLKDDEILVGFSSTINSPYLSYGVFCLTGNGQLNTNFGNEGVFTYHNIYGGGRFRIKQIQLSDDHQSLYFAGRYDLVPHDNMLISKLDISDKTVSVGIDPYKKKEVTLYPNPLKEGQLMHVDIPDLEATDYLQLQLYDSMGRLVLDKKMDAHALHTGVDMRELSNGVYFVELVGMDRHYFGKVLVFE